MKRDDGIDSIRVLLTFLVIIHHVAIVYGGAGGWYWKETQTPNINLIAFNTINQSFFMGFFFLLAGYFSRSSLDRKGARAFVNDRLIRLGIPLVVYFFLISPFTIALATQNSDASLAMQTFTMMKANEFEPGPLWFVLSLLIFSFVLVLLRHFSPKLLGTLNHIPSVLTMVIGLTLIGAVAFSVRLVSPVGQSVLWLQLGYFPMYVLLFILGVMAFQRRLLRLVSLHEVRIWTILSLLLVALLFIVMRNPPGDGPFEGGWNLNALFYAMWEPFVAAGIIFGLLYFFQNLGDSFNSLFKRFAPLAYGIYIIHPPVVVAISLLLFSWQQDLVVKFFVNSLLSLIACVLVSYLLIKIPLIKRVL